MPDGLHHLAQLFASLFAGLFCDQSDDPRHGFTRSRLSASAGTCIGTNFYEAHAAWRQQTQGHNQKVCGAGQDGEPRNRRESRGYVVARQINALEAVALFEIAEAIFFLFAIRKIRINEIGDLPLRARTDSLDDQGVGCRFIPVLNHGNYVHQVRLYAGFIEGQLGKGDQLRTKEGADEGTIIKIGCRFSPNSFDVLAVVTEGFSLAKGTLVVKSPRFP